jgi:PPK2 family polyphosphate:nucleotide phosphotransferase
MAIDIGDYRVAPGRKVKLAKWPTRVDPHYRSKADYERLLDEHVHALRELQPVLYAHNRYALLVIFQAMDAAGKDGAIKHVMSGVNPQGCEVTSFKHPSMEVLEHDFLWNAASRLPERGRIGIFNRSYYEEVLIVRVHPALLRAELLPADVADDGALWEERYRSIRDFERHLHRNGTRIVKFFLHLSKEEQRRRLLARLDEPDKNWKITLSDVEERRYWDDYMDVYQRCLAATSTRHAPWYVVPADDKPNARLIVSHVILDTLRAMPIRYPRPDARHRDELREIRARLEEEGGQPHRRRGGRARA